MGEKIKKNCCIDEAVLVGKYRHMIFGYAVTRMTIPKLILRLPPIRQILLIRSSTTRKSFPSPKKIQSSLIVDWDAALMIWGNRGYLDQVERSVPFLLVFKDRPAKTGGRDAIHAADVQLQLFLICNFPFTIRRWAHKTPFLLIALGRTKFKPWINSLFIFVRVLLLTRHALTHNSPKYFEWNLA